MSRTLRILHLEDGADDAELVRASLERQGCDCEIRVAPSGDEFRSALAEAEFDLILSDSGVPGFDGFAALGHARSARPGIPFLFVSGAASASAATPADAPERIGKNELERLGQAVARALREPASPAEPLSGFAASDRLVAAVQDLSLVRTLDAVMAVVRRAARDLTGADGATFVLRDGDRCHYADEDAIAPLWKGRRFPMETCISGWAMLNRRAVAIEDVFADDRIPADAYRPTFVKSLAMVPIRTAAPVGAIGAYWATARRPSEAEVRLLQALADSASIAMENVGLYAELEQRVADRTSALTDAILQLEETNRELEAFSYSVSHDLRAPLRAIEGFAKLLADSAVGSLGERDAQRLERIRSSAALMHRLIDDLLGLARIARAKPARAALDLSTMARAIGEDLRTENPDRSVEFWVEEGLVARGDPGLVEIVLRNLLGNAWKYTSRREDARVLFGRSRAAGDLGGPTVFRIEDNGAGFDMNYAGKLFGAFQRLHGADEFPGTGIGLATVRRIVRKHGGRIRADGRVGEGARFHFTLEPAADDPPGAKADED